VIYKPLSVQSDWTDCNSHGTITFPGIAGIAYYRKP